MARNKKFFHPYTRLVKISSYEEAKKLSIDYTRLKELALRPQGVKFWMVSGLADYSYKEEAFTNKDFINKFKPSDIGQQFGYISGGSPRRRFTDDMGLGKSHYNHHLVFISEHLANLYEKYQKSSAEEKLLREAFLQEMNMWDTGWDDPAADMYDDGPWDDTSFGD